MSSRKLSRHSKDKRNDKSEESSNEDKKKDVPVNDNEINLVKTSMNKFIYSIIYAYDSFIKKNNPNAKIRSDIDNFIKLFFNDSTSNSLSIQSPQIAHAETCLAVTKKDGIRCSFPADMKEGKGKFCKRHSHYAEMKKINNKDLESNSNESSTDSENNSSESDVLKKIISKKKSTKKNKNISDSTDSSESNSSDSQRKKSKNKKDKKIKMKDIDIEIENKKISTGDKEDKDESKKNKVTDTKLSPIVVPSNRSDFNLQIEPYGNYSKICGHNICITLVDDMYYLVGTCGQDDDGINVTKMDNKGKQLVLKQYPMINVLFESEKKMETKLIKEFSSNSGGGEEKKN